MILCCFNLIFCWRINYHFFHGFWFGGSTIASLFLSEFKFLWWFGSFQNLTRSAEMYSNWGDDLGRFQNGNNNSNAKISLNNFLNKENSRPPGFLRHGMLVLRIFFKILVMRANFDEFWGFWYGLQNFGKVFVTVVRPYWDQFWKILILKFWLDHKVTINHRGGILIFCQISNFCKNRKFEIFNPSSNPNFGSLTLNRILDFGKFWVSTNNLVLANLDRSRRQLSKNTKIIKFGQISLHKNQNS